MATLDSKKNGRFIKKGDPLLKVLDISAFDLADICETPLTYHDNASANIIHQKLHLREDLEETVRNSQEINQVFPAPEERVIIQPLDFTEEWARLKKRQSSRTMRNEDDEDFDLEPTRQEKDESPEEPKKAEEFGPGGLLDLPQDHRATVHAVQEPEPEAQPVHEPEMAVAEPLHEAPRHEEHEADHAEPIHDDFVPYAAQGRHSTQIPALERYPSEEELESIREAARQEGFRQGFQSGEEKATLEARSKVHAIMEEVANIVGNLEGMQHSILKNAQENFQAISQNMIEALLHREFHLNPESFGAVIERAISEGLNEDEFKIFVSPEIAKELKEWSNQSLAKRIKADEGLQGYDFRVEGHNASIEANIRQIVKNLLDQADLSLFDTQEKVS